MRDVPRRPAKDSLGSTAIGAHETDSTYGFPDVGTGRLTPAPIGAIRTMTTTRRDGASTKDTGTVTIMAITMTTATTIVTTTIVTMTMTPTRT